MGDVEKAAATAEQVNDAEMPSTADDNGGPIKPIDTVHQDEGMRVLANYFGDETWTDEEEKKIRRKIDWRLMPVLCLTYTMQYYDKQMLSQAALFGLRTDLGLTKGNLYSMTAAIFYLGFIVGAYPIMFIAQRYPIERVACIIVALWGICLVLTSVCRDYKDIYVQRFFLGVLESGISPMFMMIVGSWYKKDEQAIRMGMWYSCTGYVSLISPLINYGFGLIGGGKSSWRYMYYFAGSITIVWGFVIWWVLPPDPVRARGWTERERYILVARMRTNNAGIRNKHLKAPQILELLLDAKFWLMFSIALLGMICNGPVAAFVPIIVETLGFTALESLLMLMPIGFYAGTVDLICCWAAYRFPGNRTYLIFGMEMLTVLGACLLWKLPQGEVGGMVFGVLILPSLGAAYAVMMGLQIANIAGYTKRVVASSGLYIGYCLGNFIGPLLFKASDYPRYASGLMVCVITSTAAALLALVYRAVCMWDNNRRDKTGTAEGFDNAYEDDLTDMKNPQFRYIL